MFPEPEFWSLCERLGWICVGCGRTLTKETAVRDHIVALAKGGSNDISNIQPLCKSCNSRKGTKDMSELVGAEWAWTNWAVKEL